MRDHIQFFVLFSLLEVLITTLYFLIVKTINQTILIGVVLYLAGMFTAYLSYRAVLYHERKKEMLEMLP